MKKYLLFIVLLFTGFAASADQKSDAILSAMKKKFDSYASYRLNFLADIEEDAMGLEGYVIVQGNKFHMDIRNMEIIYDGKIRYTHYKDYEEVIIENISEVDAALSSNPAYILSSFFTDYDSKYIEGVKVSGKNGHKIALTPKNDDGFFTEAEVIVDSNTSMPLSISLTLPGMDNDISFRVTRVEPNIRTSSEIFSFDPKKFPGIEIIDFRN
ncbi:MAG: outer membrane lipoprotein carrier protein LolA [Rikenellaceae bacterium]|nr:outer membrane lipoprotein carrier protein LolA [Rikenellaceae bacterium]